MDRRYTWILYLWILFRSSVEFQIDHTHDVQQQCWQRRFNQVANHEQKQGHRQSLELTRLRRCFEQGES